MPCHRGAFSFRGNVGGTGKGRQICRCCPARAGCQHGSGLGPLRPPPALISPPIASLGTVLLFRKRRRHRRAANLAGPGRVLSLAVLPAGEAAIHLVAPDDPKHLAAAAAGPRFQKQARPALRGAVFRIPSLIERDRSAALEAPPLGQDFPCRFSLFLGPVLPNALR